MRILLIEDDVVTRMTLAAMLANAGYEVVEAGDGEQGLAEIARQAPDAIFCDRMMPRVSGFEVLEAVRRDWPALNAVPFFFLSGLSDERDMMAVADLNPTDYLSKPISRGDFLSALARAKAA